MKATGEVDFERVAPYAAHLRRRGVAGVFVCGTTGEGGSLTMDERERLLEAWVDCAGELRVIAHVGHSSVVDARRLAVHAAQCGVHAIAAMPSSRLLPDSVTTLVDWCAALCAETPETPFYYYHIPSVSGVSIPMREFLDRAADRLPQLAGVKFTYEDLLDYQVCLALHNGAFDMTFGRDEMLLAALSLGARSAVGSTYNFAAPLYLDIIDRFNRGDIAGAREQQMLATQAVAILCNHGGLNAIKAAMGIVGLDVGGARLPLRSLTAEQTRQLERELDELGVLATLNELTSDLSNGAGRDKALPSATSLKAVTA